MIVETSSFRLVIKGTLMNSSNPVEDQYPERDNRSSVVQPAQLPAVPPPQIPVRRSNHSRNTFSGKYLKGDRKS